MRYNKQVNWIYECNFYEFTMCQTHFYWCKRSQNLIFPCVFVLCFCLVSVLIDWFCYIHTIISISYIIISYFYLSSSTLFLIERFDSILGQERFTSMTRVYYKGAAACVIMFDLTSQQTFNSTIKWKRDLDKKCTLPNGKTIPCILVGNKVSDELSSCCTC